MKIKMMNGFIEAEGDPDELGLYTAFTLDAVKKLAEAREADEKQEEQEAFYPMDFRWDYLDDMITRIFGEKESEDGNEE